MKKQKHFLYVVFTALMASLCCVATMVLRLPLPFGYLNLGDVTVILSAWLLGPVYGAAAAGLGSMLADVFSGYPQYSAATFIIKALMAVAVWFVMFLMRKLTAKQGGFMWPAVSLGAVLAELIMVGGYFFTDAVVFAYGLGAAASLFGNAMQGVLGAAAGTLLTVLISKTGLKGKLFL